LGEGGSNDAGELKRATLVEQQVGIMMPYPSHYHKRSRTTVVHDIVIMSYLMLMGITGGRGYQEVTFTFLVFEPSWLLTVMDLWKSIIEHQSKEVQIRALSDLSD
jgi:hypothetical protein